MERPGLSALAVFVAVASRGGFRAAARDLGLSPSAVSHAIAGLEERLGVRLLSRTTRSVAPTEAGRRLLDQVQPALGEIDQALLEASDAQATPSGLLKLTAPRALVHHLLLPRFATFTAAYPGVTVEMRADDTFVDIVAEGYDAGIRLGESLQKDMIAVRLGSAQRLVCLGAPSFLATRTPPLHPRDLVDYPCIAVRRPGGHIYRWEFEKDGEELEIAISGPLIFDDSRLVFDATLAGLGLGYTLDSIASAAVARGELVRVLEDWCPPFPGFFLYYPSRRLMRPALRAFIDHFCR